ncbi:MAG: UDP-2,4-diacetamido-2,4,6-trideoxy-beta-L-altropyranose hydrolase [Nitrospiraceae bacterium]
MKVVFRVDASVRMGTGHLMRCLTLAETLRRRGASVSFVCRAHAGHAIDMLRNAGIPVAALPTSSRAAGTAEDYAAWLVVTQQADAAETIETLKGAKPDWLIVDHYGLDARWEHALRPHAGKLLVIDDLADRPHDCDVLLDQNYWTDVETRYRNLVPAGCRRLLGPRYALLRPEYAAFRKATPSRDGHVRRVLVFLGGSDLDNVTGMTLEALSAPELRELQVDVVAGANNPHREAIERQVSQRPRTALYDSRPHLADLMAQADMSVGAGGATTWERLCLGLPSLVVSMAGNQIAVCKSLAESRLINYLGPVSNLQPEQLRHGILAMVHDSHGLMDFSSHGHALVDGLGAQRLAELIDPSTETQLRLRPAQQEDAALYFGWVNEAEVRRQSINQDPIPWRVHQEWFRNKLADGDCRLLVLEASTLPVGQIRFDIEDDEAHVDYSLDPFVRGRHWAVKLITMGVCMVRDSLPGTLRADVKETNQASCAVFTRLGFTAQSSSSKEMRVFRSQPSRIAAASSEHICHPALLSSGLKQG